MHDKMKIAVVDDHPLLRNGVVHILERQPDIEVVGEGSTADDALTLAKEHLPEIILLDVNMPGGGVAAATAIADACPVVKVVMLTVSEEDTVVSRALAAGARGYILKGIGGTEFVDTLRSINSGAAYVSPHLAARLLAESKTSADAEDGDDQLLSQLTAREEQILEHVSEGLSNREIGDCLSLSEKTIKSYMTNILQKLQVRNRVTAALMAQKQKARTQC